METLSYDLAFGLLQAFQCHKVASHRVQHLHQVKAAAAEADIETTASSVEDEAVSVEDLKTGVAHVYGVRGSPEKVDGFTIIIQTLHLEVQEQAMDFQLQQLHQCHIANAYLDCRARNMSSLVCSNLA